MADTDISIEDNNEVFVEPTEACATDEMSVQFKTRKATKRKASPLFKTISKKATPGRRSQTAKTAKAKPTHSTSMESVIDIFKDPVFVNSVTPSIISIISPTIESAIENAIKTTVEKLQTSVLNPIIESNTKLQKTVEMQMDIIQEQRKIIDDRLHVINEKSEIIKNQEQMIKDLSTEMRDVKRATNEMEQYSRRTSLRFSNLKIETNIQESERVKVITAFINDVILQKPNQLSEQDIDRCHPIGRPGVNGNSKLLVKFANYRSKQLVFSSKSSLRNYPEKIFVNEDLTRSNYDIVKRLQVMKKAKQIYSYWTVNGRVLCKRNETSKPLRLYTVEDLSYRLHHSK